MDFIENMRELASDLVKKAKEIDTLIEVLPGINQTEEEQVKSIKIILYKIILLKFIMQIEKLKSLEEENRRANEEYEEAVREMGKVRFMLKEIHHTKKYISRSTIELVKKQINQSLRAIAEQSWFYTQICAVK